MTGEKNNTQDGALMVTFTPHHPPKGARSGVVRVGVTKVLRREFDITRVKFASEKLVMVIG